MYRKDEPDLAKKYEEITEKLKRALMLVDGTADGLEEHLWMTEMF